MTLIGEKKTCSNHQERHANKIGLQFLEEEKNVYGKSFKTSGNT